MQRRAFLKLGAGCAVGGVTTSLADGADAAPDQSAAKSGAECSAVVQASADEHRRRLQHIAECNRTIRKCLRRHLIVDYLPGQVVYNLGEYPCRKPWDPDEWDEQQLDELRAGGVELVQLHEEWNDPERLFGADKFTPLNEPGFRRFVKMVHDRGMKVIVYGSTGFFERRDPDFRPEWARKGTDLVEIYFRYARCSPASVGWRAYVLPRLMHIMDEYGVNGLYDDLGYRPLHTTRDRATSDEVLAFEESETHDGALADLLGILYGEIKRRGGIFKIHASATNRPRTPSTLYDYLWVGEGARNADSMREIVKHHPPYVAPCLDMSRATIDREEDLYLHAIPYMQFPLQVGGRPFTGERASIPGIEYPPEERCFWTRHCRAIWRHYQAHPEGPHTYGWWDSTPGRAEARPTYYRWLKRYRPMVEAGTQAYIEVTDSDLFAQPLPKDVVASVFANRNLYLVLANYAQSETTIETKQPHVSDQKAEKKPATRWSLAPRSLTILKKPTA